MESTSNGEPQNMDSLDIAGKVVLVAGSLGLVGRAIVKAITQAGGIAIPCDIQANRSPSLPRKGDTNFIQMDICSKKSILTGFQNIIANHGKIDAIVNSTYPKNRNYGRIFEKVEFSDFTENISLHLGGFFLLTQQAAIFFQKQGHGNLINIASIYGVTAPKFEIYKDLPFTMPAEYAAIKAGIIQITRYTARYLRGTDIRMNCISPGGILDQQPEIFQKRYKSFCQKKGMLNPNDITGTILFLLSDLSKFINGQNLVVDDGFTL